MAFGGAVVGPERTNRGHDPAADRCRQQGDGIGAELDVGQELTRLFAGFGKTDALAVATKRDVAVAPGNALAQHERARSRAPYPDAQSRHGLVADLDLARFRQAYGTDFGDGEDGDRAGFYLLHARLGFQSAGPSRKLLPEVESGRAALNTCWSSMLQAIGIAIGWDALKCALKPLLIMCVS